MKFIDLFSGIGGFRSALEKNGHECIAYSEIDKYAKKSYQAIYDTDNEIDLGDITQISQEYLSKFKEENDIVVGGSPCQSFSMAGGRRGFEDTRGTLFFEYAKVVKETQPKLFLYENVKGMLSHDKGNTIRTVLSTFDELGYYIDFNIFNSKFYDVPQNRERIYIVGIRKDLIKNPISQEESKGKKKFDEIHNWAVENINYKKILPPLKDSVSKRLIDILEGSVDEKFFLSEDKVSQLTLNEDLSGKLNHYNYNELDRVHSIYKEAPTINTMQGGGRQPKIAINQIGNIVPNKDTFGGNPQRGRVYNSEGLSPAINCMRGGGLEPKIVVVGNTSNTNHKSHDIHDPNGLSPTIAARDYKGPKQIILPVLTPNRVNKSQNGRRFKEDGEPMFTLTAQDIHGIAIKEATKKGYSLAEEGDSVFTSYVNSKTRRGRVGKQISQTLQAEGAHLGVVINSYSNFYCIDNLVYDEEQYNKLESKFVPQYVYVQPIVTVIGDNYLLLTDIVNEQYELLEKKDDYFLSVNIQKSLDDIIKFVPEEEFENIKEENELIIKQELLKNLRIRKLTPLECWRLQGFDDEQFYKAKNDGVSNSQLYKQAGNSVTVNVVDYIISNVVNKIDKEDE